MSTLVPMTELDAVNGMLEIIGAPPANSLTSPQRSDVVRAVNALDRAALIIQSHGWYWNTELEVLISNAGASTYYMPLATNVITARVSDRSLNSTTQNYVYRNGRLYNRQSRTYNFQGISSIYVDQTVLVEFEEMPQPARLAIFRRAAIDFQEGSLGAQLKGAVTEQQAVEAWALLQADECNTERFQLTSGPGQYELHYRR